MANDGERTWTVVKVPRVPAGVIRRQMAAEDRRRKRKRRRDAMRKSGITNLPAGKPARARRV